MHVAVNNAQKKFHIDQALVKKLVKDVITAENRNCHEVYIHFVTTKTICQLHADYFDDASITDCISFPIDSDDGPYSVLGEVFVCPDTASSYVTEHGGELYEEITLYTVHGLLHLLGYDDISEEDQLVMRERERVHMERLKAKSLMLVP